MIASHITSSSVELRLRARETEESLPMKWQTDTRRVQDLAHSQAQSITEVQYVWARVGPCDCDLTESRTPDNSPKCPILDSRFWVIFVA